VLKCDAGSCWPIGVRSCQFWAASVGWKFWILPLKIWVKHDEIGSHETKWVASRPSYILPLGLMSGAEMWCWVLLAYWCWIMPVSDCSWMKVLNFSSANLSQTWWNRQSWNKMSCLQTISYPPIGSNEWCWNVMLGPVGLLVSDHANFGLQLNKGFEFCHWKSESNLMTLAVMKQNELPPDHFISYHWVR
jgi:hypothetical protein